MQNMNQMVHKNVRHSTLCHFLTIVNGGRQLMTVNKFLNLKQTRHWERNENIFTECHRS